MIDLTEQLEKIERLAHVFIDQDHYDDYKKKHPHFNPRRHSVMSDKDRKDVREGELMGKGEAEKARKDNPKYSKALENLKKLNGSDLHKDYVNRNGEMFSPAYVIANAGSFTSGEKSFINDLYSNMLSASGAEGNPVKLNKDLALDTATALALLGGQSPITDEKMQKEVQKRILKYDKGLNPDYQTLKKMTDPHREHGMSMEETALDMLYAGTVKGSERNSLAKALAHVAGAKLPFAKSYGEREILGGCANVGRKTYGNRTFVPHGDDVEDNSLDHILRDNEGISHELLGNMAGWWSYKKKDHQSLKSMAHNPKAWDELKKEYIGSMNPINFSGQVQFAMARRAVDKMTGSDFHKTLEGLKPTHNLRQEMGHIIDKHGFQAAELIELSKYKGKIEKHKRMSSAEIEDELSKPPKARHFARSPAQLRQDFVSHMDPSSYTNSKGQPDPKALQAAKQRVLTMPIGEFAAMLAAIKSDEDEEGLTELSPKEFGTLGV